MRQLTIDPEFRDKVPPMTAEEFRQLEENILKAGRVRVPIIIWDDNGKETIVDGHNRYAIVQKHPEIPFDVEEEFFADRYEAIVWICKNQLGRRNLTDAQKTYLIGRQYEAQKMAVGNRREKSRSINGKFAVRHQNDALRQSRKSKYVIAEQNGIGCATVERASQFARGVDAAEKIESGTRDAILSGKSKIPKSVISELPKMPREEQRKIVSAAKSGMVWPPKKGAPTGGKIGYPTERRELNAAIAKAVASLQDTGAPVEHTVDDLLEDVNALVADFSGKVKRSLQNHSAVLQDDNAKKKVIAALSEAEAEINKMKGLLL